MKILAAIVLAALPAAVSAQTASGTLDMVQGLSVSAASGGSLSAAREDAARPFGSQVHQPQPVNGGHYNPGYNNPGHDNPGHQGPLPPSHPVQPYHPVTPPSVHPTHPVTPPVVNPHPPYYPGYYNDPFNHHGGYIGGDTHQHTSPVVSGPMSKGVLIGTVVAVAAVVLLLVLL